MSASIAHNVTITHNNKQGYTTTTKHMKEGMNMNTSTSTNTMTPEVLSRIAAATVLRLYSHAEGGKGKISDLRRGLQADFKYFDGLQGWMQAEECARDYGKRLSAQKAAMTGRLATAIKNADQKGMTEYRDALAALEKQGRINAARLEDAKKHIYGYTISEGYDIYTAAYDVILEGVNSGYDINANNPAIYRTRTLKSGVKKEYTLFAWTCYTIGKYEITGRKAITASGKNVYIEDMATDTDASAMDALDREYIKAGLYTGISTWYDELTFQMISGRLFNVLDDTKITIVRYRMRGMSISSISSTMKKDESTIRYHLKKTQEVMLAIYPDLAEKHIIYK